MLGRDHFGAGQMSGLDHGVQIQSEEVWEKEEQTTAAGRKLARSQREIGDIGDEFDRRTDRVRTLVIAAAGQGSEAFLLEHFANGGGTEGAFLIFESLADLIDRVVLLAEANDEVTSRGFFGLRSWAVGWSDEKGRNGIAAKTMTKNVEGTDGVAESPGYVFDRTVLDEEGAEGLVHAVAGRVGLEEEVAAAYLFR